MAGSYYDWNGQISALTSNAHFNVLDIRSHPRRGISDVFGSCLTAFEVIKEVIPWRFERIYLVYCLRNSVARFVIPDLIRNPVFSTWIPAFAGMTALRLL